MVTGDPKEIKTKGRLQKKLEDSVAASDIQYGRILGKWVLAQVLNEDITPEQAMLERSAQWFLRLQDSDLEDLMHLVPEEKHDELLEKWQSFRQVAAHNAEA